MNFITINFQNVEALDNDKNILNKNNNNNITINNTVFSIYIIKPPLPKRNILHLLPYHVRSVPYDYTVDERKPLR